jgi:flagellar motor protein MotB
MNDRYIPVRKFKSLPWAITFSDLCIVLLCFFILIASTARTDPRRYAEISESLQDHFGHASALAPNDPTNTPAQTGQPAATAETVSVLPAPTTGLILKPGHEAPLSLLHDVNYVRGILKEARSRQVVEVSAFGDRIKVQFATAPRGADATRLGYFQDVMESLRVLDRSKDELSHQLLIFGATDALLDTAEARAKSNPRTNEEANQIQLGQLLRSVETNLKQERLSGIITVEKLSHSVRIRLGEAGAFAPGDAALTPLALRVIDRLADVARQSDARILIGGHTDTVPIQTAHYRDNWELSAARAISVVRELVNQRDIDPARIEAQGFGDTQPMVPNDSAEHRAVNRRIEITLELSTS